MLFKHGYFCVEKRYDLFILRMRTLYNECNVAVYIVFSAIS